MVTTQGIFCVLVLSREKYTGATYYLHRSRTTQEHENTCIGCTYTGITLRTVIIKPLLTLNVLIRNLTHGKSTYKLGGYKMVLRGHEIMDILKLKHVPKVRTQITFHKTNSIVIITPINSVSALVSSFSYFKVEMFEDVFENKTKNCA